MAEVLTITETEKLELLEIAEQGPPGRDGTDGKDGTDGLNGTAHLSTDPNNRTTLGSDNGIYTPELVVDPLAYYILAKA